MLFDLFKKNVTLMVYGGQYRNLIYILDILGYEYRTIGFKKVDLGFDNIRHDVKLYTIRVKMSKRQYDYLKKITYPTIGCGISYGSF